MLVGDYPVNLFAGGDDGGLEAINTGENRYHHTINWDCRANGRGVVGLAPCFVAHSAATIADSVTAAFHWKNSAGDPALAIAGGNGTSVAIAAEFYEGAFTYPLSAAVNRFTDAILYRYNSGNQDTEGAWWCNGSGGENIYDQDDTTNPPDNTGHQIKFDLFGRVGGDLWGAQGYEIRKLTLNADPGLSASWPTPIEVGIPTWNINKIVPLGGSPIVCKPEGIFRYNPAPSTAEFQNVTPFVNAHEDNGKNAFTDGRGRIFYDLDDGQILVLTFGFQQKQTPGVTYIDRDTPWGRISTMTADIDHVFATLEPGQNRHQQEGLSFLANDGGSFTDHSTTVTDQKDSTTASLTLLTTGDFIYVGADEPFSGVYFELDADRSATNTAVNTVTHSAAGETWIACANTRDSTARFARSGLVTIQDSNNADLVNKSTTPWVKTTIAAAPSPHESTAKYWVRIEAVGAWAGVTVAHVYITPYRPPLDPDNQPLSGYELAGVLPKILVGTWRGETLVWDDVWTLDSSEIQQLVVSRTRSVHTNGRRSLFALTPEGLWYVPIGPSADPVRAPWPKLADYGESEIAMDEHILYPSGHNFGMPQAIKHSVEEIVIDMPYVQADDEVYFYTWWDEDAVEVQKHGPVTGSPLVVRDVPGQGKVLYTALMFKDGSRDAIAPYTPDITVPESKWQYHDAVPSMQQEDIASPVNR